MADRSRQRSCSHRAPSSTWLSSRVSFRRSTPRSPCRIHVDRRRGRTTCRDRGRSSTSASTPGARHRHGLHRRVSEARPGRDEHGRAPSRCRSARRHAGTYHQRGGRARGRGRPHRARPDARRSTATRPSSRSSPRRSRQIFETGLKVVDLLAPYVTRRQDRPVRGRGRRQDRAHAGADPQHRATEHSGNAVFAGVGERTREGNDLWLEMSSRVRVCSSRRRWSTDR